MDISGRVKITLENVKTGNKKVYDSFNSFTYESSRFIERLNHCEITGDKVSFFGDQTAQTITNALPTTPMWKTLVGGLMLFEKPINTTVNGYKFPSDNRLISMANIDNNIINGSGFYGSFESFEEIENGVKEVWHFPAGSAEGVVSSLALTYHDNDGVQNPFGIVDPRKYLLGHCRHKNKFANPLDEVGLAFYADSANGQFEAFTKQTTNGSLFKVKRRKSLINNPLPPYNNLFIGGNHVYEYADANRTSYAYSESITSYQCESNSELPVNIYYGQDGFAYGISTIDNSGFTYFKISIPDGEITQHEIVYEDENSYLQNKSYYAFYKGKVYFSKWVSGDVYSDKYNIVAIELENNRVRTIAENVTIPYGNGSGRWAYPTFGGVIFGCGIYIAISEDGYKVFDKLPMTAYPLIPVNDDYDFCITSEYMYRTNDALPPLTIHHDRYYFLNPTYLGTVYNFQEPLMLFGDTNLIIEYELTESSR